MLKRLREVIESIAFAGMKPGNQATAATPLKWLGPLRGPIERLLSGGASADPLYLSNRTLGQKARSWSLIGIPCLVLAAVIGVLLSNLLAPPPPPPVPQLSTAEIADKILPNLAKNIKVEQNTDVEVLEVGIQRDPNPRLLAGKVRNNTYREIAAADFVFDLTDSSGSQLGAVRATVEKIPPASVKDFQFPIKQQQAAFALVRNMSIR